ncbi:histidine phosphatase family protein [Phytohabitans sp. ZYX-F-186]|uniref:Histidine phosphatase family protein n=1 Tax=Phytohabitans maris TaxID=3071409 RepID=A0ABU0ZP72_9ACTN|nr:histidine phosphatase family protein [Phytohabitans sp. ZYX-F-186]MDQ7908838.1 histidine phosphatase family protein [Phytohabitans sp. ZYX-F-186]
MRLVLIRHGESEHGRRGLVAGPRGCPGLTQRGREQARALRRRFADEELTADVLLSSGTPRAQETARILAPAVYAQEVLVDCDLCELHPGDGDGLPIAEFAARYGSFDVQAEPNRVVAPGGECWNDFVTRVRRTTDALPRRFPGRRVVAVTHGGFISWAFLTRFDVPRPGTGAYINPSYTSITEWDYTEPNGPWVLMRYNDVAHLE